MFTEDIELNIIADTTTGKYVYGFNEVPTPFFHQQPYVIRHTHRLLKNVKYEWLALVRCTVCERTWLHPVYGIEGEVPDRQTVEVDCCVNKLKVHAWIHPVNDIKHMEETKTEDYWS